jgi:hypothetical protein
VAEPRAIDALWLEHNLPSHLLNSLNLTGTDPALPSSFFVGTAAQTSVASAGLAALHIAQLRGAPAQLLSVDMHAAALECTGYFSVDAVVPNSWDKIAGLYSCGVNGVGGFIRLHTNFAHHRDGLLQWLGLPVGSETGREAIAQALTAWHAEEFEDVATRAGLVVAAARTFEQWDRHPQSNFVNVRALVDIERIGDAPAMPIPPLSSSQRPLEGIRILDLTRILAGPVCGKHWPPTVPK